MLEDAHRKLAELHEYARHAYQLFVAWFTVFISVNFATMGWFAKGDDKPAVAATAALAANAQLLSTVALLFVSQHMLGVVACVLVDKHLRNLDASIRTIEQEVQRKCADQACMTGPASTMPLMLYRGVLLLFATAMVCIGVAWLVIRNVGR